MENTEKSHDGGAIASAKHRRPVICIAVSDVGLGVVARTLLRATERGFSAFVVVPDTGDSRVGELAERLDAYVLELDFTDGPPVETAENVARGFGFPGMVYTESSEGQIDFVRLEEQFEATDDYSFEAPTRDQSNESRGVVAAIPVYNEADTIGEVVESVRQYADEVVVIDDGSTDETARVAERAGATVVEHESNRGYGAAVKTAFTEAHDRNAEVLVTIDGDGQHDADDVPKLVEAVRERDANLVIGSRFHSGDHHVPRYRRVGLFVINVLTNLSLGFTNLSLGRSWVSDTQSGLRAFDQQAIASLATDETLSDNMSASTDVLYHVQRNDYEIAEVGTTIYYEDHETSTQNPVYHGFSVVSNILRTIERERPLTFIGLPGLTTTLVGFGLGYWAVLNYLQTGTFPTGLVLFCIFTTVIGSLLALTGVILHSIKTHVEAIPDQLARR